MTALTTDEVPGWLAELGETLDMADKPEADQSHLQLEFGDLDNLLVVVRFNESLSQAVVYASLGELPEDVDVAYEIMGRLLECNLFGDELQGGHIGLEPYSRLIILSRCFAVDTPKRDLAEAVMTLAQDAYAWQRRLDLAKREIKSEFLEAPAPPMHFHRA